MTMDETPHRPIRTLSYRLHPADALAFAMLKHELTFRDKLRLLILIGAGGLAVGQLPQDMESALWWFLAISILGIAGVLAVVWTNVDVRRKAASLRLPDGAIVLQQWSDHLSETSDRGVRNLAFNQIAQVIRAGSHVFIREGATPLIVPAAAFENQTDMAAFAEAVDEASNRARP